MAALSNVHIDANLWENLDDDFPDRTTSGAGVMTSRKDARGRRPAYRFALRENQPWQGAFLPARRAD